MTSAPRQRSGLRSSVAQRDALAAPLRPDDDERRLAQEQEGLRRMTPSTVATAAATAAVAIVAASPWGIRLLKVDVTVDLREARRRSKTASRGDAGMSSSSPREGPEERETPPAPATRRRRRDPLADDATTSSPTGLVAARPHLQQAGSGPHQSGRRRARWS